MKSLVCDDIKDAESNQMLVRHLSSDDFFDVAKYPMAKFQLTAAEPIPPGTAGSPNYKITGRLTLKGVTDQVTFSAIVGQTEPATIAAQGNSTELAGTSSTVPENFLRSSANTW